MRATPGTRMAATLGLLATVGGMAGACTEITGDPSVPVAIELVPSQLPFIVAGDSLRDTLGVVRPLEARALNSENEVIPGAPISFVVIDTGTTVEIDDATGFITGVDTGSVRVIASVGELQSLPITIVVTLRPDTIVPLSAVLDSIQFLIGRESQIDLRVRVLHDTTPGVAEGTVPVRSYVVHFRIVDPPGLPVNDSTIVQLVNDNRRASTTDTTDASGEAKRTVRLSPAVRTTPPDSIIVEATATRPDQSPVPGSPIRFVVKITP